MNNKQHKNLSDIQPQKIIVLLPKYIGDSIMALPAIKLLQNHFPQAHITLMCQPLIADLLDDQGFNLLPDFRRKNKWSAAKTLIHELKQQSYDLGILFSNTFLDALIFKLGKVKTIIGYNKEARGFLLDYHEKIDRVKHYSRRYAHLLNAALGFPFQQMSLPKLEANQQKSCNPFTQGQVIGLYLGSPAKKLRQLPEQQARELIQFLMQQQFNVLLFGGPEEQTYMQSLADNHKQVQNLAGTTSVNQLLHTIADIDLLISIDSSPVHIAAAVNIPFIALLGKSACPWSCVAPLTNKAIHLGMNHGLIEDEALYQGIRLEQIAKAISLLLQKSKQVAEHEGLQYTLNNHENMTQTS